MNLDDTNPSVHLPLHYEILGIRKRPCSMICEVRCFTIKRDGWTVDSLEEADSCNDSVLPCYLILSAVDGHKSQ
jgi:hypothetical protein